MKAKRNHSDRIERRPALQYLAGLRDSWARAYEAACKHDSIDPSVSDGNPFVQFVDRAASELFQAMREYQAGGYIGLQIQGGKEYRTIGIYGRSVDPFDDLISCKTQTHSSRALGSSALVRAFITTTPAQTAHRLASTVGIATPNSLPNFNSEPNHHEQPNQPQGRTASERQRPRRRRRRRRAQREQRGRLIAAAPQLLAACKIALEGGDEHSIRCALESVISKSERGQA